MLKDQWFLAVELLMGEFKMAVASTQEKSLDGELIEEVSIK